MGDNPVMICSDINNRLKSFLEDLLTEKEYQAFLAHLDSCAKCKKYVRAVGSVSNQLWKLGDVKVPADFSSTALFKLKQAKQEIRIPKFVITKKWIVGAIVLILIVSAFFFGIRYFEDLGPVEKSGDVIDFSRRWREDRRREFGRQASSLIQRDRGFG